MTQKCVFMYSDNKVVEREGKIEGGLLETS